MASDEQGYNGWKNYPTWCVNLWLSNDEPLYREALVRASAASAGALVHENVPEIWTVEQAARFTLADDLKTWVEELGVEIDTGVGGSESGELIGFGSDLYAFALSMVDWEEIAVSWLEAVAEQVDA